MNINLSISPALSITGNIAVVIYAADAPTVQAGSQEFTPPHAAPRDITFADVEPKTYIVNTYETPGLPTLGTLRHSFIYDPTFISAEVRLTEFLHMTGGAGGYTDATYVGWDIESIERVGSGTQYDTEEIDIRDDGWDLLTPGDTFADQEKWVVRFYARTQTVDPVFRSAKVIRDYRIIATGETLTESDSGVGLRIQGAAASLTITLPVMGAIENALMFCFLSDGGSHINATINGNGNNFGYRGGVANMILAQAEQLWVGNDNANNTWVIDKMSDSIKQTGRIIDQYDNDYEPGLIFADGSLLSRTSYARLWAYVNQLNAALRVSDAAWLASSPDNKGKYSTGDGSTTFRLPRLYTTGFLRAVDNSTRLAGSKEDGNSGTVSGNISLTKAESYTGPPTTSVFGTGFNNPLTFNYPFTFGSGDARPPNYGVYKLIQI